MTNLGALLVLSTLLLSSNVAGSVSKDSMDSCSELVASGKCRTDPEYMIKNCKASCTKWLEGIRKVEVETVADGEPSFFDLEAKNSTGSAINFERFEGYITIVTNVAKSCVDGVSEKSFQAFEDLHSVWPFTLEIVVFTFEHPGINYKEILDCKSHEQALKKSGRKIHVMEEAQINGPDTHTVYKYLKGKFGIEELENDYGTFFLVTPDGDTIEAHHGATPRHLKDYIRLHLQRDL